MPKTTSFELAGTEYHFPSEVANIEESSVRSGSLGFGLL